MLKKQCSTCKQKKNLSLELSVSQLVFGGFRCFPYIYRCEKCEKKLITKLSKMLSK